MLRIICWLQKRGGFWFPLTIWAIDRIFQALSVGHRLNTYFEKKSLGGHWVSEFYQLLWVLIGLCWIALIELPVLTAVVWTVIGVTVAFYRALEILLFSFHWLLVAEGRVESYRRSLLGFLVNLCEVAMFFVIAYLLLGCFDPSQGAWSALFQSLRSVFSFETLSTQCKNGWHQTLPRLQLVSSWILVTLIVANVVGAIDRGDKTRKTENGAV